MTEPKARPVNVLLILTFLIAVAALFFPRSSQQNNQGKADTLQRIRSTKVLKIGFEGYPPYTQQDPRNSTVTGYSVDLANEICSEAGWTAQWVRTGADTKISDLDLGKFDVMVEPIFETIPRAREVGFTLPYAYFGYAAGIVRKGDQRFRTIEDANTPQTHIVVRQGYTDEAYVRQHLPKATLTPLKVNDASLVFLEVLSGQADIALGDVEQVKAFADTHKDSVDTVFINPAPAYVPAGFMVRQDDLELVSFFNTALASLRANGEMQALDKKYNVTSVNLTVAQ